MRLEEVLFSQGFGTRRECSALIRGGEVEFAGEQLTDPEAQVNPVGQSFCVSGHEWPFYAHALIALNKPAMYECSQKPACHPSVMKLLPAPLRVRGVQPVGRLDVDATGLLLLTDDGALIHRLTHPKKHVPKVYEVTCSAPVSEQQVQKLLAGVLLQGEKVPCAAQSCEQMDVYRLRLTITSGKYHQVKRMVTAAGNHVAALHRTTIGAYCLPENLEPGQWVWLPGPEVIWAAPAAEVRHA